jgi:hypothetical protein
MKTKLSFILSLIATLGLLALAWFKEYDITAMLPVIVTGYVVGRSVTKASHIWAISKDPNADTKSAIDKLES